MTIGPRQLSYVLEAHQLEPRHLVALPGPQDISHSHIGHTIALHTISKKKGIS